jgi:uncharacterized membrane protein YqjE
MDQNKLEQEGLITNIEHIWSYSWGIISNILRLFTLEVKLAGKSLATILMLIVIGALLLVSFWLSILGAIIAALVSFHLNAVLSLLLLSAINLIAAIAIGIYIVKISSNLQFKETRKQLDLRGDKHEPTPKD